MWYGRRIAVSFHLSKQIDLSWLRDREYLSPIQSLSECIEVLLASVNQSIVIFIDEIDSILSLNFRTDDFFAFIRSCHEYDRLTIFMTIRVLMQTIKNIRRFS
jgi:hypothetical protein